jgi:hypothetical protein
MARARIDDNEGAAVVAARWIAGGGIDPHNRIIDRPLAVATVQDHFIVEGENGLKSLLLARDVGIATLAQNV